MVAIKSEDLAENWSAQVNKEANVTVSQGLFHKFNEPI